MWIKPAQPIDDHEFANLKKGDGIKLNLNGELFWVTFQGKYRKLYGKVDNHISCREFNYGNIIEFEKENVWFIMTSEKRKKVFPLVQLIAMYCKPTMSELEQLTTI